jgi:Protein of unknown function (DUF2789)
MNLEPLTMNSLFGQLGLMNTDSAIIDFLRRHSPMLMTVPLHKSSLWNLSQAAFLRQAIEDDADWCALVDQLDARLREDSAD